MNPFRNVPSRFGTPAPCMISATGGLMITNGTFTLNQTINQGSQRGLKLLMKGASPSAFHNSGHQFDPPKCHPNTRVAVQTKVKDWIFGRIDREAFIMWLYGGAGAGKSAIGRSIAEWCETEKLILASFFFSRTDPIRNNLKTFVATIAYDIVRHHPAVKGIIEVAVDSDPHIFTSTLEHQFTKLILGPLAQIDRSSQPHPYVIIIDGLDECLERTEQKALLRLFISLEKVDHGLKFLLASRPEQTILSLFNALPLKDVSSRIALSDQRDSDVDIRRFLYDKFEQIKCTHPRKAFIPSDWPSPREVQLLVAKSSGHFIFASTVIKYIESDVHKPVARLISILNLNSSAPSNERDLPFAELDALYTHILCGTQIADHSVVSRVVGSCILVPRYWPFGVSIVLEEQEDNREDYNQEDVLEFDGDPVILLPVPMVIPGWPSYGSRSPNLKNSGSDDGDDSYGLLHASPQGFNTEAPLPLSDSSFAISKSPILYFPGSNNNSKHHGSKPLSASPSNFEPSAAVSEWLSGFSSSPILPPESDNSDTMSDVQSETPDARRKGLDVELLVSNSTSASLPHYYSPEMDDNNDNESDIVESQHQSSKRLNTEVLSNSHWSSVGSRSPILYSPEASQISVNETRNRSPNLRYTPRPTPSEMSISPPSHPMTKERSQDVDVIVKVLDLDEEDVHAILGELGSIIEVSDQGIRVLHASLEDFLFDEFRSRHVFADRNAILTDLAQHILGSPDWLGHYATWEALRHLLSEITATPQLVECFDQVDLMSLLEERHRYRPPPGGSNWLPDGLSICIVLYVMVLMKGLVSDFDGGRAVYQKYFSALSKWLLDDFRAYLPESHQLRALAVLYFSPLQRSTFDIIRLYGRLLCFNDIEQVKSSWLNSEFPPTAGPDIWSEYRRLRTTLFGRRSHASAVLLCGQFLLRHPNLLSIAALLPILETENRHGRTVRPWHWRMQTRHRRRRAQITQVYHKENHAEDANDGNMDLEYNGRSVAVAGSSSWGPEGRGLEWESWEDIDERFRLVLRLLPELLDLSGRSSELVRVLSPLVQFGSVGFSSNDEWPRARKAMKTYLAKVKKLRMHWSSIQGAIISSSIRTSLGDTVFANLKSSNMMTLFGAARYSTIRPSILSSNLKKPWKRVVDEHMEIGKSPDLSEVD